MAPRKKYPSRTAARTTRSQTGSTLYAGLESSQRSAIRRAGLRVLRAGRTQDLPRPPRNRPHDSVWTEPFRVDDRVHRLVNLSQAQHHVPYPDEFWSTLEDSQEFQDAFFSGMSLATYHSLRSVSRFFAKSLPPYMPGMTEEPSRIHILLAHLCQNVRLQNKRKIDQHQLPRPRTYHRSEYMANGQGAGRCINDHADIERRIRDPATVLNFWIVPGLCPTMKTCDGTRLGLNVATPQTAAHAPDRPVCRECSDRNWRYEDFTMLVGEHKLSLCFECSKSHYGPHHDDRLHWDKYCTCWRPHRAGSEQGPWLCDRCRVVWSRRKIQEWKQKLSDSNHDKRRPIDAQNLGGLGEYIHDGDMGDRSRCRCGAEYQAMKQALPISNVAIRAYAIRNGGPDYRYTFRECLECGGHNGDIKEGLNRIGVLILGDQELTSL